MIVSNHEGQHLDNINCNTMLTILQTDLPHQDGDIADGFAVHVCVEGERASGTCDHGVTDQPGRLVVPLGACGLQVHVVASVVGHGMIKVRARPLGLNDLNKHFP